MIENPKYILDLDGTLYEFEPEARGVFADSAFGRDLADRTERFVAERLGLSAATAAQELDRLRTERPESLSLALEREHGIDRLELFAATWDCAPEAYLEPPDPALAPALAEVAGDAVVLTAAPRVWAERVLEYLDVAELFAERLLTGEPDVRKPDPAAFQQALELLEAAPEQAVSVGDQNHSDILPAKRLGMTTVRIGPEIGDADYRADSAVVALELVWKELIRKEAAR